MIRQAFHRDIDAISNLGVEALERNPIGSINRKAIRKMAGDMISSREHFVWVSEIEGKVEGALAGYAMRFDFHIGKVCRIMQYYVRPAARGDGIKLLRKLHEWIDRQPAIRLCLASIEIGLDPRIQRLMERLGYKANQIDMIRRAVW